MALDAGLGVEVSDEATGAGAGAGTDALRFSTGAGDRDGVVQADKTSIIRASVPTREKWRNIIQFQSFNLCLILEGQNARLPVHVCQNPLWFCESPPVLGGPLA